MIGYEGTWFKKISVVLGPARYKSSRATTALRRISPRVC